MVAAAPTRVRPPSETGLLKGPGAGFRTSGPDDRRDGRDGTRRTLLGPSDSLAEPPRSDAPHLHRLSPVHRPGRTSSQVTGVAAGRAPPRSRAVHNDTPAPPHPVHRVVHRLWGTALTGAHEGS